MSTPVFAVVGHPNKGKSSLVAALAQDSSVAIGPQPGTTVKARRFPMRVDGQTLYTLVDTPGFQRPRAVLEWLHEQEVGAAQRPRAVADFVQRHTGQERFSAECELLAPIANGAGILYVVDGALPYAAEYEAEMEILRWTGAPSIAVINPIGGDAHVEGWTHALGQYFRVVRVLDARDAPFDKRLQVLSAFGELAEAWREPMTRAVAALRAERGHTMQASARAIAALIEDAVHLQVERRLAPGQDARELRAQLEERYREGLRRLETACRARVEAAWRHERLERNEPALQAADEDLFAEDTWLLFGLARADLAKAGVAGGALAGLGVDAAVGGTSLFAGAALGAVIGGVTSWFSADALAQLRIDRLPLGGRLARYGPSRNANLPFVLLGRARTHHRGLAARSHARREVLDLSQPGALNPLSGEQRDALARAFTAITKSEADSARRERARTELQTAIARLLEQDAG